MKQDVLPLLHLKQNSKHDTTQGTSSKWLNGNTEIYVAPCVQNRLSISQQMCPLSYIPFHAGIEEEDWLIGYLTLFAQAFCPL